MSNTAALHTTNAGAEMGQVIRSICELQGLKDKDLAARVGMSSRRMSDGLNGKLRYGFTKDEERAIAAALGVATAILSLTPSEAMERLMTSGYNMTPLEVVEPGAGQMQLAFTEPPALASVV